MSESIFLEKLLDGAEVEWVALEEPAEIYDGTPQTPKYRDSGVPFASVQNIKVLYATEKCISSEDFNKYKYKPPKDDLFMTRIGDIGTCAIVKDNEPLAYYVTLSLIRVDQTILLPGYLKHVIESGIGKSEIYTRPRRDVACNVCPNTRNNNQIKPWTLEQTIRARYFDKLEVNLVYFHELHDKN